MRCWRCLFQRNWESHNGEQCFSLNLIWVSSFSFAIARVDVFAELLTRLQLHVSAANIRKYIELEEVKSSALVRQ